METAITPTPERLVNEEGRIQHGYFQTPFRELNFRDARGYGSQVYRKFRLKEWVGYGITHPDWYMSMMIQDSKYLGSGAMYVFDRRNGKMHEYGHTRLLAKWDHSLQVAASPWEGQCRIEGPGFQMRFEHRLSEKRHTLRIDVKGKKGTPDVRGELFLTQDLSQVQPLVLSAPVRPHHTMYTHKAPMPIAGTLTVGGNTVNFDPLRDLANLDEHKALYPYRTSWRWMTFVSPGHDGGKPIGVNLADHMMVDEENLGENCAWTPAGLRLLGPARFEFDPSNPMAPWKVHETRGPVALHFQPEGIKREKRNFGLAGIDYYQVCGRFDGTIPDGRGGLLPVAKAYGVCEKMDVRF